MARKKERERKPLPWNESQTKALYAIFAGQDSLDKIALDCAIPPRTLDDWIAHPDFQARLQSLRDELEQTLIQQYVPYVRKEQRIIGLAAMAQSARTQYEERPWLQEKRQIGINREVPKEDPDFGAPLYLINEAFNRDAHAAFRESLNDIAKELGHRQTKVEHSGNPDAPLVVWTVPQKPR